MRTISTSMFNSFKSRLLLFTTTFVIFMVGVVLFLLPSLLQSQLIKELHEIGISDVQIARVKSTQEEIMLSGLTLDENGFSTIETLRARANWMNLFGRKDFFQELLIDDLQLAGLYQNGTFEVTGVKPAAALAVSDFRRILLSGGQLDLATDEGILRFEAKGELLKSQAEDGSDIQDGTFALWAKQFQLAFDSRWQFRRDQIGIMSMSGTLNDGHINGKSLDASRVSGWIHFERGENKMENGFRNMPDYDIGGQFVAGQAQMGDHTALLEPILTIAGSLSAPHYMLRGKLAEDPNSSLYIDLNFSGGAPLVAAFIETENHKILLETLVRLRQDFANVMPDMPFLMPLMLTEGNINRLKEELAQQDYDYLKLEISGTLTNLHGKIMLRKRETPHQWRTSVISLAPS